MQKEGYYSSGQFARMACVTLRTIRYYDKQNILKPSFVTESGARFYTDEDFARLQQILLLKYLGFSLEDIRELTLAGTDSHFLLDALSLQQQLIQDKIEQMQLVENALENTIHAIKHEQGVDWSQMLNLIHLTGMEKSLKKQYQNASNITARINLHQLYSDNPVSWFSWIYNQCRICPNTKVLEVGCGGGSVWEENLNLLPKNISVTLSDISEGMLRDARRRLGTDDKRFSFEVFNCENIPFEDNSFDLVLANHVLFYCENIPGAVYELNRVLKKGGRLICSTYGSRHMQEISELVKQFDERIVLSGEKLYDKFGKENGASLLSDYFKDTRFIEYKDFLTVTEPEPLISYILSCHGNQRQYILDRYKEFTAFVKKRTDKGFHITKEAGIFVCCK